MSKISDKDYEKYDLLFYKFIKFLDHHSKEKDLIHLFLSLGKKEEYFFNEIKIENDIDYNHFFIKAFVYNSYDKSLLDYTKTFIVVYSSNLFKEGKDFTSVELVFGPEDFYLIIENKKKRFTTIEKEIIESYTLPIIGLNNFEQLWKRIFHLIKETIENE